MAKYTDGRTWTTVVKGTVDKFKSVYLENMFLVLRKIC